MENPTKEIIQAFGEGVGKESVKQVSNFFIQTISLFCIRSIMPRLPHDSPAMV